MKLKYSLPVLILAAVTSKATACATCAGGDNLQLANASNSVLWALLSLVGFIFVATAATAYYLWRKASTPIPPHLQLIESLNPADAED
jgi:hypothetical protein